VTIGSGVFGWLRVKVCIFPYTLKVVLTTLTLPCECDADRRNFYFYWLRCHRTTDALQIMRIESFSKAVLALLRPCCVETEVCHSVLLCNDGLNEIKLDELSIFTMCCSQWLD